MAIVFECLHQFSHVGQSCLHILSFEEHLLERVEIKRAHKFLFVITLALIVSHHEFCQFEGVALACAEVYLHALALYSLEQCSHKVGAHILALDIETE